MIANIQFKADKWR